MPKFAQRYKRFAPLLVAPAYLLLLQGQAQAIVIFEILQTGADVTINTSGSISQLSTIDSTVTTFGGAINASFAGIAAGARPREPLKNPLE
jgi:hypothetical protein